MKSQQSSIPCLHLLIGVSLAILPLRALAQAEQETLYLNPFVVTTDSVKEYYATETLSGTQLRTPVRDLANPITILTEEFMRDIGAVNYEEALEFLPSTRAFNEDSSDPEGVTSRTGTPYTVRGFRSTSLTNNFFTTRIKVDNYNTETVTQSRGPNSLLFGLGSVGARSTRPTRRGNSMPTVTAWNFDSIQRAPSAPVWISIGFSSPRSWRCVSPPCPPINAPRAICSICGANQPI